MSLDQRLPLADQGAELVSGEAHAPEVGETLGALDILDTKADLTERIVLALVEVSEGDFEHAALETVRCDLCRYNQRVSRANSVSVEQQKGSEERVQQ